MYRALGIPPRWEKLPEKKRVASVKSEVQNRAFTELALGAGVCVSDIPCSVSSACELVSFHTWRHPARKHTENHNRRNGKSAMANQVRTVRMKKTKRNKQDRFRRKPTNLGMNHFFWMSLLQLYNYNYIRPLLLEKSRKW